MGTRTLDSNPGPWLGGGGVAVRGQTSALTHPHWWLQRTVTTCTTSVCSDPHKLCVQYSSSSLKSFVSILLFIWWKTESPKIFFVHRVQLLFLDPTGSLAFTLLVGWLVTILLNCKLNLQTFKIILVLLLYCQYFQYFQHFQYFQYFQYFSIFWKFEIISQI